MDKNFNGVVTKAGFGLGGLRVALGPQIFNSNWFRVRVSQAYGEKLWESCTVAVGQMQAAPAM